MRTTIDLDASLLERLRDIAHHEGTSFRAVLHRVIHLGLAASSARPAHKYQVPAVSLGRVREGVDLTKALSLASALEDEERIEKIERRK